ncbi:MAG: phosphoribosylglycinamide formyltransferase [Vagococcus sp.]
MMRFSIFASGTGSNFEAIVQAVDDGVINGEIACLFCDVADAYVIERAKKHHIPYILLEKKSKETKKKYEKKIVGLLDAYEVTCIILAGYMKILGPTLLQSFPQRIVNIHPSLLPEFPGKQGILDAYQAGVKKTGITIHLVDNGIDTGPIMYQESLPIYPTGTLEELEERVHQLEHSVYPKIIAKFLEGERENDDKKASVD